MKVLFLTHRLTRNGATLALLQELSYLYHNCKDIEFEVFSPFEGQLLNDFRRLCRTQFLQYRYRDKIKRYLWTRILRKPYLYGYKKGEFDLIYANTVTMASIAFMLKQELEIPCILHFHEAETSNFLTPIRKEHVVGHDLFITVSELTKKNVIHNYGIHPSKILIQPPLSYWLDQCPQDKEQIDPLPDSGSKILIGLCGRYDWVKSSDLIPVIIKLFFTKHPDATCQFVYVCRFFNNIEKSKLEYDLKKSAIQDKLTIVEEVNNPLPYFKRFDIFLMPSREESFSLTAQEAALTKTPVVGFDGVTGIQDLLKGDGGIFVPYMDLEKLVDAIYALCTNQELRNRMGANGNRIMQKFKEKVSKMEDVVKAIRQFDSQQE